MVVNLPLPLGPRGYLAVVPVVDDPVPLEDAQVFEQLLEERLVLVGVGEKKTSTLSDEAEEPGLRSTPTHRNCGLLGGQRRRDSAEAIKVKPRRIDPLPEQQLGRLVLRDALQQEGRPAQLEGLLHRAAEADGPVERPGEDDGRRVADGPVHADGTVDGLGEGLGLGAGVAGIEHDDADVVLQGAEEVDQGLLGSRASGCPGRRGG